LASVIEDFLHEEVIGSSLAQYFRTRTTGGVMKIIDLELCPAVWDGEW